MAITVISATAIFEPNWRNTTPLTYTVDPAAQVGDFMVAFTVMRNGNPINLPGIPAGWTPHYNDDDGNQLTSFATKLIEAGDPSSYDWTSVVTVDAVQGVLVVVTYRGVDNAVPFDVVYDNALHHYAGPGELVTPAPTITTNTPEAMVGTVTLVRTNDPPSIAWTTPTGYTMEAEYSNAAIINSVTAAYADRIVNPAGLEDNDAWTVVGGTGGDYADWSIFTIALRPAGGGAPTPPVLSNATTPVYNP